jgi:hypothetical protein
MLSNFTAGCTLALVYSITILTKTSVITFSGVMFCHMGADALFISKCMLDIF